MTDDEFASDPAEFWERRHDLSIRPTTADDLADRGERRGRHLDLVWDLPVGRTDEVVFERLRDRLSAFDCLTVAPPHYLHVSVKAVGRVVPDPDADEEFSTGDLPLLADAIGTALDGVDPFEVRLPRLNLFPTVVYSEIDDDGRFAALNDRVGAVPDVPVHERDQQFIPHAALAEFVGTSDYPALVEALEDDRTVDVGPVEATTLDLVSVDLSDRFPRLESVRRYDL